MAPTTFTHAHLVKIAVRWLQGHVGCDAVLAEPAFTSNLSGEIPDAIGWKFSTSSILVECKVSRADFLADKDKVFRKVQKLGVGRHRYFMVPRGLVKVTEVDDWGLLEVDTAGRVHRVADSTHFFQRNEKHEIHMLVGALRRVQIRIPCPLYDFIGPVTDPYRKSKQSIPVDIFAPIPIHTLPQPAAEPPTDWVEYF